MQYSGIITGHGTARYEDAPQDLREDLLEVFRTFAEDAESIADVRIGKVQDRDGGLDVGFEVDYIVRTDDLDGVEQEAEDDLAEATDVIDFTIHYWTGTDTLDAEPDEEEEVDYHDYRL